MTTGDIVRAAHLHDLELPGRRQLLAFGGETDNAVGDGELRGDANVLGRVLADQQRRRPPRRHADGEVVDERPAIRDVGQEVVDGLEAVDGHEVGFLALDAVDHVRQRLVDATAPQDGAEVGEDDTVLDQAGVEEREELHVAHDLQWRLGERGEVEALLPLPRVVEERLEREDGLSRTRLAGDDRHRRRGNPTTQDRVQRRGPGAQPHEGRSLSSHCGASSLKSIRASRLTTTGPVSSMSSSRNSATTARSALKASSLPSCRHVSGRRYS